MDEEQITSKKQGDRFLAISIVTAAVVIAGSLVYATVGRGTGSAPTTGTETQSAATSTPGGTPPPLGSRDVILGDANASVTLIEYGDYQCPFCGRFFSQVEPQLRTDYINTGKVKMVYRNFQFLGPESIAAGEAAECAKDQNQFWKYRDALYAGKVQDDMNGGGENDGFFSRALFLNLAAQLNLDIPVFTTCIDSNKYENQIQQDKADAAAIGVNSTPTIFINGQEIQGAQPYSVFSTVINAALANQ